MSRPGDAGGQLLALVGLVRLALAGRDQHLGSVGPGYHDHAVVIGHHHVAGMNELAGAHHRHVHASERALDRAPGRDRARPHRKPHGFEVAHVPHPGVGDQPPDAPRLRRGREQVPEHAVGVVRGAGDDQEVAGLAQLDGHVHHPVVARLRQDGDRAAGGPRAGVDRADVRLEQPGAAPGLVHRGDPELAEAVDGRGVGALDAAHSHWLHRLLLSVRGRCRVECSRSAGS